MKNKIIIAVIAILTIFTVLTGCGSRRAICDFCEEKKRCKVRHIDDETIYICQDCIDEFYEDD